MKEWRHVTDRDVINFLDRVREHGMAMHVQLLSNAADAQRGVEQSLRERVQQLEERLRIYEPPKPLEQTTYNARSPADADG